MSIISVVLQPLINATTVVDGNTQIEKLVSNSLDKNISDNVDVTDVEFDNGILTVTATTEQNAVVAVTVGSDKFQDSVSNIGLDINNGGEEKQYSLFFGTPHQKEEIGKAAADDTLKAQELSNQPLAEEPLSDQAADSDVVAVQSDSEKEVTDEVIDNVDTFNAMPLVITDEATGKEQVMHQDDGVSSVVAALPVGIALGASVGALMAAGALILVGGVAYVAVSKIASNVRTRSYNYYKAIRHDSKLYVGNGIGRTSAVMRLFYGSDTWSDSQSRAKSITSEASLRKHGSKNPIGPERDQNKNGYYRHYHLNPRKINGSHSFYGIST